ncbi:MAG: hypothetical protein AAF901_14870, partial [Bacteroidota bacterium]
DDGDDDLLQVTAGDSLSDLSFTREDKSNYTPSCADNFSIGNRSVISQLTVNDIVSAPGNVLPWLADPGNGFCHFASFNMDPVNMVSTRSNFYSNKK